MFVSVMPQRSRIRWPVRPSKAMWGLQAAVRSRWRTGAYARRGHRGEIIRPAVIADAAIIDDTCKLIKAVSVVKRQKDDARLHTSGKECEGLGGFFDLHREPVTERQVSGDEHLREPRGVCDEICRAGRLVIRAYHKSRSPFFMCAEDGAV